jgi:hypothetical protein
LTQFQIQPRFGGAFLLPCIDTVQGFCFARRRISQAQAFTAAFLPSMQIYGKNVKTVYKALQRHFR